MKMRLMKADLRAFAGGPFAGLLALAFAFLGGASAFGETYYHQFDVTLSYAGTAVTNVPALLRLAEYDSATGKGIKGFRYNDFRNPATGTDLEVLDTAGNSLPYEIDTWDATGESLVWVRMPVFEDGAKLTVVYGRSTFDGTTQSSSVWSEYTGVWHLNELDETATETAPFGAFPNSTAIAGLEGKKARRSEAGAEGRFGKSVMITRSEKDDYTKDAIDGKKRLCHGGVFVSDSGTSSPLDVGDSKRMTISGWFKNRGTTAEGDPFSYDRFFFKRDKSGEYIHGGFAMECDLIARSTNDVAVFTSVRKGVCNMPPLEEMKDWFHMAFVFQDEYAYVYTNGVSTFFNNTQVRYNCGAIEDNDLMLGFGNCYQGFDDSDKFPDNPSPLGDGVGERSWNGWIDEVRLRTGKARSAEYIAAEYAAMAKDVFAYAPAEAVKLDETMPVLGALPTCAWDAGAGDAGAMVFSVVVTSGRGKVYAQYTDLESGDVTTVLAATLDGTEAFPVTVTNAPALTDGHMYSFAVIARNEDESQFLRQTGAESFYFGALAVACQSNAQEETMTPGVFRVSRADTPAATVAALTVRFALSGSAVAGGAI
ncbi:MAG: DUF2341 domain-containing protein, partial [Kiritimatiellae bacterium]|nr:DUF2341 domain-containing protein [Kiritimatiellia bacterium]